MKCRTLPLLLLALVLCDGAAFAAAASNAADPLLSSATRKLLQEAASPLDLNVPFTAASVPTDDPLAALRSAAGGVSDSAPRPFCRTLNVYAPVDNYDQANLGAGYQPAGYFQGFGTLTFSYQARDATTGAFVKVSPRFALTLDPLGLGAPDCVFIQSDGSESKTSPDGLGIDPRPVGWRCTYLLDPASIPASTTLTKADPQTFKAGSTCSMLRRFSRRNVVSYQGKTAADFTYTPGVTDRLTVECKGLPTQVCGDLTGPSGKEVVPCASAGVILGRAPFSTLPVVSAYGSYILPPIGGSPFNYRSNVIGFSQPGVNYSPISGELLRYGLNLQMQPDDPTVAIAGDATAVIDNAVCIFGFQRAGLTTRVEARIIANPRRNTVRAECRFEQATC